MATPLATVTPKGSTLEDYKVAVATHIRDKISEILNVPNWDEIEVSAEAETGKFIEFQLGMLDLFIMSGRDVEAAHARNNILAAAKLLQDDEFINTAYD